MYSSPEPTMAPSSEDAIDIIESWLIVMLVDRGLPLPGCSGDEEVAPGGAGVDRGPWGSGIGWVLCGAGIGWGLFCSLSDIESSSERSLSFLLINGLINWCGQS